MKIITHRDESFTILWFILSGSIVIIESVPRFLKETDKAKEAQIEQTYEKH